MADLVEIASIIDTPANIVANIKDGQRAIGTDGYWYYRKTTTIYRIKNSSLWNGSAWEELTIDANTLNGNTSSSFAPVNHSHVIANITGLQAILDDLQAQISYVPLVINSLTNNIGVVEFGSTVMSTTINWVITGTVVSQTLTGFGALSPSDRSGVYSTSFNMNKTFTLVVNDSKSAFQATTTVYFRLKNYYGFSADTDLTTAQILGLTTSEFATGKTKSTVINGSGQYWYYCFPLSYGDATFTVNGLVVAFTKTVVNHTNASGYTEAYNVYRSPNVINGSNISVVVS